MVADRTGIYVDGSAVPSHGTGTMTLTEPARGSKLAAVSSGSVRLRNQRCRGLL